MDTLFLLHTLDGVSENPGAGRLLALALLAFAAVVMVAEYWRQRKNKARNKGGVEQSGSSSGS